MIKPPVYDNGFCYDDARGWYLPENYYRFPYGIGYYQDQFKFGSIFGNMSNEVSTVPVNIPTPGYASHLTIALVDNDNNIIIKTQVPVEALKWFDDPHETQGKLEQLKEFLK
jgi:hypothetical protein